MRCAPGSRGQTLDVRRAAGRPAVAACARAARGLPDSGSNGCGTRSALTGAYNFGPDAGGAVAVRDLSNWHARAYGEGEVRYGDGATAHTRPHGSRSMPPRRASCSAFRPDGPWRRRSSAQWSGIARIATARMRALFASPISPVMRRSGARAAPVPSRRPADMRFEPTPLAGAFRSISSRARMTAACSRAPSARRSSARRGWKPLSCRRTSAPTRTPARCAACISSARRTPRSSSCAASRARSTT